MAHTEETAKQDNYSNISDFLVKGAIFNFKIEDEDEPFRFSVAISLGKNAFACKSMNSMKLVGTAVGKEVMASFPTKSGLYSVRVRIINQSTDGANITIMPIDKPTRIQQRKHFRLKTDEAITFSIQFDGNGNIYRGIKIEDIGQGGLGVLVRTASEVDIGTRVRITVELSKQEPVTILGEVTNCSRVDKSPRTYRIGIRFINTKQEKLISIVNYIRKRIKLRTLRKTNNLL